MTRNTSRQPRPFLPRLEALEERLVPNNAPVLTVPAGPSVVEGQTVSLFLSATDADNDPLTFSITALPPGLSLNATTGLVSGVVGYTAAGDAGFGTYGVIPKVSDGSVTVSVSVWLWNVSNTNRLPNLTSHGTHEGASVSLNFQGTDNTGTNSLSYSATGLPSGLSLDASTGLVWGAFGYRVAGITNPTVFYSTTLTLTDDHGGTDKRTLSWSVTNSQALSLTLWSGTEGATLSLGASGGVASGLTYTSSTLPQGVTLNGSTGLFTGIMGYANALSGSSSTVLATVSVSDSLGLLETKVVTWGILDNNRLPSSTIKASAVAQSVSVNFQGSDNTGTNSLTYSATALPTGLSINASTGIIGGTVSAAVAAGSVSTFYPTVTLNDNHSGTDYRSLTWAISNPTFGWSVGATSTPSITSIGNQSSAEGTAVSLAVSATDPSTYPLLYAAVNLPAGLSLNSTTGLISGTVGYQAGNNFGGLYDVVVLVANDHGGSASRSFSWTVSDTPRSPTITSISGQSSSRGNSVSLQVSASDPDGGDLFYYASGLPDGLEMDTQTGLISGIIAAQAAESSPYSVQISVEDGSSDPVSQTVAWTVAVTNHAPTLDTLANQSSAAGDEVFVSLAAQDRDDDVLTFTASGLPSGLTIDLASGDIYGTLANGAASTLAHSVTVVASDGQTTASRSLLWTVGFVGLDDPGSQSGVVGDTVSFSLTARTAGTGSLSYTAASLPAGLSLNPSTGLITGTLTTAANNTVTLTASDGTHSSNKSLTWSVARLDLNNPGLQQNAAGGTVSLPASVIDVGGTPTYSVTGLPSGLSLNAATGLISGTLGLTAHAASPYRVTLTATDSGASDAETFVWAVSPRVALLNPRGQASAAGHSVSLSLTANASAALTYSASGLPTGLSINATTGLISGTLGGGTAQSAPYSVTVTASDGTAQSSVRFDWSVASLLLPDPADRDDLVMGSVSLGLGAHYHGAGTLSYSASGLPSGVSLNAASGLLSGTLASSADVDSPYFVTATVTDGTASVSQVFGWYVEPRVSLDTVPDLSNVGGDSVSLDLSGAHALGGSLTYSATGLPSGLTLNTTTGLITGTIATGAVSGTPASVTLSAADSVVTVSQSFNWSVVGVGLDDVAQRANVKGQSTSLGLSARAATGSLTYSATGLPAGLSINSSTGLISGTPATVGAYLVGVTAFQGAYTVSHNFEWDVLQAGASNPGAQSDQEGDTVSLALQGASGSAASLTYSASSLPDGLSLNASTGLITGTLTPGTAASGPYLVTVGVNDGAASSQHQFLWSVSPFIALTAPADQNSTEGNTVSLSVVASSAGTASLTYSAEGLPSGLSLNASSGLISGTVASGAALDGDRLVAVTASDGTYSSDQFFLWTVAPSTPPAAPVVTNPGWQAGHTGAAVELQVEASDAAGYSLSYSASGLPQGLWIDPYTGLIYGTIAADAARGTAYSVTVTADDGIGQSDSETFPWLVRNPSGITVGAETLSADEGQDTGTVAVGSFTTPDLFSAAEDFSALINWGDGTTSEGIIVGESGSFVVYGNHAFEAADDYTLGLSVTTGDGASASASGSATAEQATLTLTGGYRQGVVAGQSASVVVARLEYANPYLETGDFTVEIDPGDGSSPVSGALTPLGNGEWLVRMTHTYAANGTYTAEVNVTGPLGAEDSQSSEVVAGSLAAGKRAILSVPGIGVGDAAAVAGNYTATIFWGDGSNSAGTISGTGGQFTVQGDHTFAGGSFDESGGAFAVAVQLTGPGGLSVVVGGAIPVVQPSVTGHGVDFVYTPDEELSNVEVAVFTVPNAGASAGDFAATVDWGDGSVASSGAVVASGNGVFRILGTHTYVDPGFYHVSVELEQGEVHHPVAHFQGAAHDEEASIAMDKIKGPDTVPGNSIYSYVTTFFTSPKDKLPIVTVKVKDAKAVSGKVTHAFGAHRAEFQVRFEHKPVTAVIEVEWEHENKKYTAKQNVVVVQVKVSTPNDAFSLPNGGVLTREAVIQDYRLRKVKGGGTFQVEGPHEYIGTQDEILKKEGIKWKADVKLVGPGPGNVAGINKIMVGFIQVAIKPQIRTLFPSFELRNSGENQSFLDATLDPDKIGYSAPPWYPLPLAADFLKGKSGIITATDSPSALFVTKHADEVATLNIHAIHFDLSVAATIIGDKTPSYWMQGTTKWSLDFSGTYANGKWKQNKGAGFTKPESWNQVTVASQAPSATSLPLGNEYFLDKAYWEVLW